MNTQELMLKIRGDNTDLENKLTQSGASIKNLGTSTEKVFSAMEGFGQDLLRVRDASDLASIATKALGTAIGASIGGAIVISAGRALIDAFNKVQNAAKESETAISKVREQIGNIRGGVGFEEARSGAAALYSEAEKVAAKIKEIESNPLTAFIAGISGAKEQMSLLVEETKKQAKELEKTGIVNTLIDKRMVSELDETGKKIRAIGEEYAPLIEAARKTGDQELLNNTILQAQRAQAKVIADDKKKQDEEQERINEKRRKADADRETENELYEINRQRNLERTRKDLEQQVKQAEAALAIEKEKELLKSQDSNGAGGAGGSIARNLFQTNKDSDGIEKLILGKTTSGRQSLEVARRQRRREVSRQDFMFQEKFLESEAERLSKTPSLIAQGKVLTKQDVRNRLARKVAENEIPSLREQINLPAQGLESSQLASSKAGQQTTKQGRGLPDLISAVEKLISKIDTAPLVTSGAGA